MEIAINKLHFPVTSLGPGRRIGIWFQGCSIHCPGCVSRDTWDFDPLARVPLDQLWQACDAWLPDADGITISGGEPFDQPEGLRRLVERIRALPELDLLVFSGYPHETLARRHPEWLPWIDVLITDPFQEKAGRTLMLRGSDNQRVFLQTELARTRYPDDLPNRAQAGPRPLDLHLDGETLWMAGIPADGDMARLREHLARKGYLSHTSDQSPIQTRA